MQVAKWGNSLAVRLPATLVKELGLQVGDELNVVNARKVFVGMTRGQLKVELVLSDKAAQQLAANIG